MARDIEEFALAAAVRAGGGTIKFRNVAFVDVAKVRQTAAFDVFAEPIPDDVAHSNIVIWKAPMIVGTRPEDTKIDQDFIRALCDLIDVCAAGDFSALEGKRVDLLWAF